MHQLEKKFIQLNCLRTTQISSLEEMFKLEDGEKQTMSILVYQHLQKLLLLATMTVIKSGVTLNLVISSQMNCSAHIFLMEQDHKKATVEVN